MSMHIEVTSIGYTTKIIDFINEKSITIIKETSYNSQTVLSCPFQRRIIWSILSSCMVTASTLLLDKHNVNWYLNNENSFFNDSEGLYQYITKLIYDLSAVRSLNINHDLLNNLISSFIKIWDKEVWYNDDTYPTRDMFNHIINSISQITSHILSENI